MHLTNIHESVIYEKMHSDKNIYFQEVNFLMAVFFTADKNIYFQKG